MSREYFLHSPQLQPTVLDRLLDGDPGGGHELEFADTFERVDLGNDLRAADLGGRDLDRAQLIGGAVEPAARQKEEPKREKIIFHVGEPMKENFIFVKRGPTNENFIFVKGGQQNENFIFG